MDGPHEEQFASIVVLRRLERLDQVAEFHFLDGELCSLRIISTSHFDEGGDVVAEVFATPSSASPCRFTSGTFINFLVRDVVQIKVDGSSAFNRESGA